MSITFTSGDMFDINADILVNPVNCVGVMGAGLALTFKNKYPDMFQSYKRACFARFIEPGKLHLYRTKNNKSIVNFPTKKHWKDKSQYSYIIDGLKQLCEYLTIQESNVVVAIPALGCGLGGLNNNKVATMIKAALSSTKCKVYVFMKEPNI